MAGKLAQEKLMASRASADARLHTHHECQDIGMQPAVGTKLCDAVLRNETNAHGRNTHEKVRHGQSAEIHRRTFTHITHLFEQSMTDACMFVLSGTFYTQLTHTYANMSR